MVGGIPKREKGTQRVGTPLDFVVEPVFFSGKAIFLQKYLVVIITLTTFAIENKCK